MLKKKIALLGSTGSVGTQTLSVVNEFPALFEIAVLTAANNVDLLVKQALEFSPEYVAITNEKHYLEVKEALRHTSIVVLGGEHALCEVAQLPEVDLVVTALVGFAGLAPTLAAIEAGKDIAIANKETLVVAGEIVMKRAKDHKVRILPVDSEHSAIFQCLMGERNAIEKIILTASGGPFRGKRRSDLEKISPEQALKHPNWKMGRKISIDSASLMNKGLEVIEAHWLFDVDIRQIDVIIHPQSVIHSMVQFEDGSIKAQMGLPDMKLPIQVALSHPIRIKNNFERFDFMEYPELTFEKPDLDVFVNLALAYEALEEGGVKPCVLNAANEVVVAAFLKRELGFLAMSDIVGETMAAIKNIPSPQLADFFEVDRQSRRIAEEMILKNNFHIL